MVDKDDMLSYLERKAENRFVYGSTDHKALMKLIRVEINRWVKNGKRDTEKELWQFIWNKFQRNEEEKLNELDKTPAKPKKSKVNIKDEFLFKKYQSSAMRKFMSYLEDKGIQEDVAMIKAFWDNLSVEAGVTLGEEGVYAMLKNTVGNELKKQQREREKAIEKVSAVMNEEAPDFQSEEPMYEERSENKNKRRRVKNLEMGPKRKRINPKKPRGLDNVKISKRRIVYDSDDENVFDVSINELKGKTGKKKYINKKTKTTKKKREKAPSDEYAEFMNSFGGGIFNTQGQNKKRKGKSKLSAEEKAERGKKKTQARKKRIEAAKKRQGWSQAKVTNYYNRLGRARDERQRVKGMSLEERLQYLEDKKARAEQRKNEAAAKRIAREKAKEEREAARELKRNAPKVTKPRKSKITSEYLFGDETEAEKKQVEYMKKRMAKRARGAPIAKKRVYKKRGIKNALISQMASLNDRIRAKRGTSNVDFVNFA